MKTSEILREGKARIERYGWTTGVGGVLWGTGPRCMLGGFIGEAKQDRFAYAYDDQALAYLCKALAGYVPTDPATFIWQSNDFSFAAGARSAEEADVIGKAKALETYDKAIALAERDEQLQELQDWVNTVSNVPVELYDAETVCVI